MSRKHIEIHPTIVTDPKTELKGERQLGKIGIAVTLMLMGALVLSLVYACSVQAKLDRYLGVHSQRDAMLISTTIEVTPKNVNEYALFMRGFELGYAKVYLAAMNTGTPADVAAEMHNYTAAVVTKALITENPALIKQPIWAYFQANVIKR